MSISAKSPTVWLSIPLGFSLLALSGCLSGYHSSLVSPPAPQVEKEFDLSQMDRYKADIATYTEAVEGNVVASTAAIAGGTACPVAPGAPGTPTKLAFCTQGGKLVVQVLDSSSKLVTDAAIQINISSTPSGVTGATTVSPTKGVATFDQLYLNSPGSYTLTANAAGLTAATTTSFTVAINLDRAKYFRNKVVDTFTGDIDHVYGEYTNALYVGRGFQAVEADFVNLGLTAATAISLVTRTKTILAALATGAAGVNLSFDKNFFGQQTFAALAIAMQARRDQARSSIYKNELLSVTDYTLAAARRGSYFLFLFRHSPGCNSRNSRGGCNKISRGHQGCRHHCGEAGIYQDA